jgi:hypothetical protein
MFVHITFKINDPLDVQTSRVTVTDRLTPGQLLLVIGTRSGKAMGRYFPASPEFQYYPMADIESFWVEEN